MSRSVPARVRRGGGSALRISAAPLGIRGSSLARMLGTARRFRRRLAGDRARLGTLDCSSGPVGGRASNAGPIRSSLFGRPGDSWPIAPHRARCAPLRAGSSEGGDGLNAHFGLELPEHTNRVAVISPIQSSSRRGNRASSMVTTTAARRGCHVRTGCGETLPSRHRIPASLIGHIATSLLRSSVNPAPPEFIPPSLMGHSADHRRGGGNGSHAGRWSQLVVVPAHLICGLR